MINSNSFFTGLLQAINSVLTDAETIEDMLFMQDWEDVDPGDLQKYWSRIVCELEKIKEMIEAVS